MEKFKNLIENVKALPKYIKIAIGVGVVAIAIVLFTRGGGKSRPSNMTAGGTRTTTLHPTTLSDSVTVTGKIISRETVNITSTVNDVSVVEIPVQEGDSVKKGDIIAKLDTSDILKNINKVKEKISENLETAQNNLDQALLEMNTAEDKALAAESQYNTAKTTTQTALNNFNNAKNSVKFWQEEYDKALRAKNTAQNEVTAVLAKLNDAKAADLDTAYIENELAQKEADLENASNLCDSKLNELAQKKNSTNYDQYESEYNQAVANEEQLRNTLDTLEKSYSNAKNSYENAKKTLENASTSDELEALYEKYENCTIKATASGTITKINAQVGSSVNGTVAVIEDTEHLKISTSFKEYDVQNINIGMKCNITSDANDNVLSGYVSQISQSATNAGNSSDVSFSAEITIDGTDHGLLIGMNAKAEVILTQLTNIYVVPFDAVGTNDNGEKIVYVQNGDDFQPLVVETGMETDYYIQIISAQLEDGMVIRSSANVEESQSAMFNSDGEQTGTETNFDFNPGAGGGNNGGPRPQGF